MYELLWVLIGAGFMFCAFNAYKWAVATKRWWRSRKVLLKQLKGLEESLETRVKELENASRINENYSIEIDALTNELRFYREDVDQLEKANETLSLALSEVSRQVETKEAGLKAANKRLLQAAARIKELSNAG